MGEGGAYCRRSGRLGIARHPKSTRQSSAGTGLVAAASALLLSPLLSLRDSFPFLRYTQETPADSTLPLNHPFYFLLGLGVAQRIRCTLFSANGV